ncbi:MAG: hypothetical protein AAFR71_07155 [Pseudomonadota bacterium]
MADKRSIEEVSSVDELGSDMRRMRMTEEQRGTTRDASEISDGSDVDEPAAQRMRMTEEQRGTTRGASEISDGSDVDEPAAQRMRMTDDRTSNLPDLGFDDRGGRSAGLGD